MTIESTVNDGISYSGNDSATNFPFPFKVNNATQIEVIIRNASGVETVLGSGYTVNNPTVEGSGSVDYPTAGAPLPTGSKISINPKMDYKQETDIRNQGRFDPQIHEAAFDTLMMHIKELRGVSNRAVLFKKSSAITGALFDDDPQDGHGIVWDGTTGKMRNTASALSVLEGDAAIVAGSIDNINAVADDLLGDDTIGQILAISTEIEGVYDIRADVVTVADIAAAVSIVAANDTDISAVAANATNINTVAGISGNVTTVAGISANVTTVAGIAANVTSVAGNATNINTVAGIASDVSAVAAVDTEVGVVAGIDTEVAAVSAIAANVTTVAGIAAAVSTVAGISGNVTTVAGISANVTTVAGISAAVTTVAGISSAVSTVSTNAAAVSTVSTNIAAVNTVSTNIAAVNTVSGIAAAVSTVSGISANVSTVAGVAADVTTVAGISTEVDTVAGISGNVTTVAGIAANVTTVAGIDTEVTTVAGISANVTTVAGIAAGVSTVAANVANITIVADNIDDINDVAAGLLQNNYTAIIDPTVNDDVDLGYSIGSKWLNTVSGEVFMCIDTTNGAAVWTNISIGADDLGALAVKNTVNNADWSGTALAVGNGGTGATDASGARTALGLVIGTNVQAYHASLASIAGLTTLADRMIYTTASNVYAVTTLSSYARTLIDDADAAAAQTTLGLVIGTNVQAYDATLASIAGISGVQGDLMYASGTDAWARLAKDANATRYLSNTGGSNNPAWAQVNLTNGVSGILPVANGGTNNAFFTVSGPATSAKTYTLPNATCTILTSNSAVTVAQGGTGLGTLTANNLLVGAGTGNVTFIAPGTSGNVLKSNGATWASAADAGIQALETTYTTNATHSTTIPYDDTIPQNTEGVELLTQAITPTSATSKIVIDYEVFGAWSGAGNQAICALFVDSTANALGVAYMYEQQANNPYLLKGSFQVVSGSTSSRTYKLRVGPSGGSFYSNGDSGGRKFGGVSACRIRVTEYPQ